MNALSTSYSHLSRVTHDELDDGIPGTIAINFGLCILLLLLLPRLAISIM